MEKKYWVKSSMRANLDSMYTKVRVLLTNMQDEGIPTVSIMGQEMDEDALYNFSRELIRLINASWDKVDGKTYGRIKAISDQRDMMRYATCIANGMDESRASYAFMG